LLNWPLGACSIKSNHACSVIQLLLLWVCVTQGPHKMTFLRDISATQVVVVIVIVGVAMCVCLYVCVHHTQENSGKNLWHILVCSHKLSGFKDNLKSLLFLFSSHSLFPSYMSILITYLPFCCLKYVMVF
jgi:hypothetical protein